MQKYAFDPNTGKVFTPNKDVEGDGKNLGMLTMLTLP